jgi:predicted transcriptional regulator
MARPTKLTPEVAERIVNAIRAGNYAEQAARAAGISPATYYRWLKRGEREAGGIYHDFYEAVRSAEAEAEVYAVAIIRKAMGDDWRAAAHYLERRHPQRWRRHETREHTGEARVTTEHLADPKTREELREIARRITGAGPDGPGGAGEAG